MTEPDGQPETTADEPTESEQGETASEESNNDSTDLDGE